MLSATSPISILIKNQRLIKEINTAINFFSDFFGFSWEIISTSNNLAPIILIITDEISEEILIEFNPEQFRNKFVLWTLNNVNDLKKEKERYIFHHPWEKLGYGSSNWFTCLNVKELYPLYQIMVTPHSKRQNIEELDLSFLKKYFSDASIIAVDFPFFVFSQLLLTGAQINENDPTIINKSYFTNLPILDVFMRFCWNIWLNFSFKKSIPLFKVQTWPFDVKWITTLTHDIDHIKYHSHFSPVLTWITRFLDGQWPDFAYLIDALMHIIGLTEIGWNLDRIMKIERQYKTPSTYFFLRKEANMPAVEFLKKINKKGWDVQLHPDFDESLDSARLNNALEWMEANLISPRFGVRNHYLKFKYPETWEAQQQAGLMYDTTIGFNRGFGCCAGTFFPYRIKIVKDQIEIPMICMDNFWNIPRSDAFLRRFNGYPKKHGRKIIDDFLRLASEIGGLFTINWHNSRFRLPFRRDYSSIIQSAISLDASFWKTRKLADWWLFRTNLLQKISLDKKGMVLKWKKNSFPSEKVEIIGNFPTDWIINGNRGLKRIKHEEDQNGLTSFILK